VCSVGSRDARPTFQRGDGDDGGGRLQEVIVVIMGEAAVVAAMAAAQQAVRDDVTSQAILLLLGQTFPCLTCDRATKQSYLRIVGVPADGVRVHEGGAGVRKG
jgi:hypothetical protein